MNPSKDLVLSLYRKMIEIREFEYKARAIFRTGKMPGFLHLYVGEEAVAAGVCSWLRSDDYVASTHRGHGHALAKGITPRRVMSELMGTVEGCCGGRGGSMHLYDRSVGFLGSNGVVPPGILIAAGAALTIQMKKTGQVAIAFFGEGAVNNGAFHEGLNLSAVWNLPVIFVCENNMYATEMPFREATKNISVSDRAMNYKMPGVQVDGNDVLKVHAAAGEAIERARRQQGPTLVECLTYRWFGHHEGDAGMSYRTQEEIAAWKERDPIGKLREDALANSWASTEDFERVDRETHLLIEDAASTALSSSQPAPETALDHVFVA